MKKAMLLSILIGLTIPNSVMGQDTLFTNNEVEGVNCYDEQGNLVFLPTSLAYTNSQKQKVKEYYFGYWVYNYAYFRYRVNFDEQNVIMNEQFSFVLGQQECFWIENFITLHYSGDSVLSIDTYFGSFEPTEYNISQCDSNDPSRDCEHFFNFQTHGLQKESNFYIHENQTLIYSLEYDASKTLKRKGFYSWNSETRIWEECFYWLYYSETGVLEYSVTYPTTMGIEK